MTASCPTCGRHWTSLTEAHCTVCHAHFTSVSAFDRHRPGRGGCPDPAALTDSNGDPALRRVDRNGGPVWAQWYSDEDRAAMRRRVAAARQANAGARSAPSGP